MTNYLSNQIKLFQIWYDKYWSLFKGLNSAFSFGLYNYAFVIGLLVFIPVNLFFEKPIQAIFIFSLLYYTIIRLDKKYLLFCIWLTERKLKSEKWFYMNRQEEVISFSSVLALFQYRKTSTLVLLAGVILGLGQVEISTYQQVALFALFISLPLLTAFLINPSPEAVKSVSVISPKFFLLGSASLLLMHFFIFFYPEYSQLVYYVETILSGSLSLFVIASLVLFPFEIKWIVQKIILDNWKVHYDRTPADSFFLNNTITNLIPFKKIAWHTNNIRNAYLLKQGENNFKFENSEEGITTGVLVELFPTAIKADGELRFFLNDSLVAQRPLSSFSRGWNLLSNFYSTVNEPLPSALKGSITPPPKKDINHLRIVNTGQTANVFLECPSIIKKKRNSKIIITVVVDALRKDYIGLYDKSKPSFTPNIDTYFGEGAAVYTNAWVQGEWTITNFAHMFTSLYSSHHHSVNRYEGYKQALPKDQETLAEVFQKNGWHTYFLSASQRVNQSKGFDRGFSRMTIIPYTTMMNWDVLYRFLDEIDTFPDEDHFVVLHMMDVHGPPVFWSNKRDSHSRFRQTNRKDIFRKTHPQEFDCLNKSQVEELDLGLSLLFGLLEKPEYKERVSLVLTADHGQIPIPDKNDPVGQKDPLLGNICSSVPLLVKCPWRPELKNKTFDGFVESGIDIYPSLLDLAGLSGKPSEYSKSFLPVDGKDFTGKEFVITESIYEGAVQTVIREKDMIYYRKFNWRQTTTEEEEIWMVKEGQMPTTLIGNEKITHTERFRKIITEKKLIQKNDNPLDYYGSM